MWLMTTALGFSPMAEKSERQTVCSPLNEINPSVLSTGLLERVIIMTVERFLYPRTGA